MHDTTKCTNWITKADVFSGLIFIPILIIHHNITTYGLPICNILSSLINDLQIMVNKAYIPVLCNKDMNELVHLRKHKN